MKQITGEPAAKASPYGCRKVFPSVLYLCAQAHLLASHSANILHMWKGQRSKLLDARVRACVHSCVRARVFKPSAEAYLIGRLVVGGGAELSEAAGSSCAAASVGHTPQFLRLGGCEALD